MISTFGDKVSNFFIAMASENDCTDVAVHEDGAMMTRASSMEVVVPGNTNVDLHSGDIPGILAVVRALKPFDIGKLSEYNQLHTIESEIEALEKMPTTANMKVKFDAFKKKAVEETAECANKIKMLQGLHHDIGTILNASDASGATSNSNDVSTFLYNIPIYDFSLVRKMEEFVKLSKELKLCSTSVPKTHLCRNFWALAVFNRDQEQYEKKINKKRARMGDF